MKKVYRMPVSFKLTPGDDPGIILSSSQVTSGEDGQLIWDLR